MKMNPIVGMAVLGLALVVAGCDDGKKSPAKECQSGFLLAGDGECVADPCAAPAASQCSGCQGKADGSYTCQGCLNGSNPALRCAGCPAGQWLQQGVCVADPCAAPAASQCSGCQGRADGGYTCQGCLNGKDPALNCGDCPSGQWLYQGSCIADPCLPALAANCTLCTPTAPGQYLCNACQPGYKVANGACVDVDECALGIDNCGSLPCINTPGSFQCGCADGQVKIVNLNKCVDPEWAYWSMKKAVASPRFTLSSADSDHYDDALTGLQWRKTDQVGAMSWGEAKQSCAALGGGWRVPTVIELSSSVNYAKTSQPMTDLAGVVSSVYWTATPYDSSGSFAWYVALDVGYLDDFLVSTNFPVRCVR